jgi:hypothetical protein
MAPDLPPGVFIFKSCDSTRADMTTNNRPIKVKIKDREQFQMVFPLPLDNSQGLGRFLNSIIGQTIWVKQSHSSRSRSGNVFLKDGWVIMPDWIEWFDTDQLVVPAGDGCEVLSFDHGVVVSV